MYCSEIVDFRPPYLYLSLPLGVTPVEYLQDIWHQKTGVCAIVRHYFRDPILRLAVLIVEL